ncbi:MAG: hypothetical protein A2138_07315 [Deltaproteobacteria bacterium RBG_16_71_12]|nr:MAG: hypothetical protein A2138_07315 [Deltaproteobacteria bacterium RBG_16_71_12]
MTGPRARAHDDAVPDTAALVAAAASRSATDADLDALAARCESAPAEVAAALAADRDRTSMLVYGRVVLASAAGPRLLGALVETGAGTVLDLLADPNGLGLLITCEAHMPAVGAALERAGRSDVLLPGVAHHARLAFQVMVGVRDRDVGLRGIDAHVAGLAAELRRLPPSLRPRVEQAVREVAGQVAREGRHAADVYDMHDKVLRALSEER